MKAPQTPAAAPDLALPAGPAGAGAGKRTQVEAAATADDVVVTARSLRVRSAPSTRDPANVIGHVQEGDRLTAVGARDGWLVTPYAGATGYVSAAHTRPTTMLDRVDG